ncbi:MAG: phosphoribosylglycinamide formyltransferase [Bacteroidota bacterium]
MPNQKYRIAVFASGNGTNAEEIFKHFQHHASIEIVLLLSNNENAYVLERAKKYDIGSKTFNREQWKESKLVLDWLQEKNVTHIVLAGFMWLIPEYLVQAFPNKIINIHPALLPKFGGKGMYGMKVHQAVQIANEKETGITIHLVNEKYDEGKIILQARCLVESDDTAEQIARKVHQLEYEHYPMVIEKWVSNT